MLNYLYPYIENTTVDIIINGLCVQDKTGNSKKYLRINLRKSAGRYNKKRNVQPYEVNDFDLLWVFPSDIRRYMFIIPMYVLIEKNLIKTDTQDGLKGMYCVIKNIERNSKYNWTQEYCFDTEDEDIQDKVIEFLEEIKNNIV